MQVSTVTLTGADDGVSQQSLADLSHQFPFVEWAILFSPSRQGSDRYPSREWIEGLVEVAKQYKIDNGVSMNLAAHLCGEYSRQFLRGFSEVWVEEWPELSRHFQRIQLNISDFLFTDTEFLGLAKSSSQGEVSWKEVIVQTRRPFERATYISSANSCDLGQISLLYDASGGKGLSPKKWPKPPSANVRFGFAGGIGPHNVEEVLGEIKKFVTLHDSWIDMETGARDAVGFSLERCREVLSKSKYYIGE